MGEYADLAIEQGMDEWLSGECEYDDDPMYGVVWKTCRNCGERRLEWGTTNSGWRLFDSEGHRHICKKKVQ